MTTVTTTSAPVPIHAGTGSPWQATRGAGGLTAPVPVHLWTGIVKAQKIGIADRSAQNMGDMTINVKDNKGRAGT